MSDPGPWIQILRDGEETPELLEVYEQCKITPEQAGNILAIHGLNPPTLRGHYQFYRSIMYGPSPLSRSERETIAVAVSVHNECRY